MTIALETRDPVKQAEREMLARQTAEFLKRGGKIERVASGINAEREKFLQEQEERRTRARKASVKARRARAAE